MNDEGRIRKLLTEARTIAVVGMSDKPDRDSNRVGKYLKDSGYAIIPVNPAVPEIYGERSYPSLRDIPPGTRVDIVDVFRKSEAVPGIVKEALALHPLPLAVWLQIGVVDDITGKAVVERGIEFVQNECIMVKHKFLFPAKGRA